MVGARLGGRGGMAGGGGVVRRGLVSSRVSVLVVGSGGVRAAGVALVMAAELMSVSGGVLEWASKVPRGVKADCMASASFICFFLSVWLEAKRTTKKAKR